MMIQVYAISDATGTTAEGVVRAALTQFNDPDVSIVRLGGVRSKEEIRNIIVEAAEVSGIVVHTLVSEELRREVLNTGRSLNVTTIDLMGPLLARLSELLAVPPRAEPGLFQPFDRAYLQRIEAIDFTVRHDDGQNIDDLDRAEIVLVGISRTSKTPLSIYLAYRGWRVANVPIVLGVEPPPQLFLLPKRRVICLVIKPERLVDLRQVRVEQMGTLGWGYADLDYIKQEIMYAYQTFERRRDWPLVDVTAKPVEEAASEIVTLIGQPTIKR